jgi:hypothetical protein
MGCRQLAPIALFAYRRPRHLQTVLGALGNNPEAAQTALYVFADGARDSTAVEDVTEVRRVLSRIEGFASAHVVLREGNYGLAQNITQGVSEVLERSPSVIVVEDDILVSPFFLRFMNEALVYYRDEPRVGSISGYCYPIAWKGAETYFIRGADCWGWATWRDRWQGFNRDGKALLRQLRDQNLTFAFDFDGTIGFTQMLEDQIVGRNDSWAIRWHASCFLRNLLILYPCKALAQNIGHDESGTHSTSDDQFYCVSLGTRPIEVGSVAVEENLSARQAVFEFFSARNQCEPPDEA